MMKNFFTLFLLAVVTSNGIYAQTTNANQEYTLKIKFYARNTGNACLDNNFLRIYIDYQNGQTTTVLDRQVNDNFTANDEKTYNFNSSNPVVKIRTENRRKTRKATQCTENRITYKEEYLLDKDCKYQYIDHPFERMQDDWMEIKLTPKISLSFPDTEETSTTACVTSGQQINATPGFSDIYDIYSWEFEDFSVSWGLHANYDSTVSSTLPGLRQLYECLSEQSEPISTTCYALQSVVASYENDYYRFLNDQNQNDGSQASANRHVQILEDLYQAYSDLYDCLETMSPPVVFIDDGDCEVYFAEIPDLLYEYNAYLGPYISSKTNGWTPIKNKKGQENPIITLRDLYPGDIKFNEFLNKPINIRIQTSCNDKSDSIDVTFLPEPPPITKEPNIIQPACSYNKAGGFKILLDREIYDNEKLDINVLNILSTSSNQPLPNQRTPEQLSMNRNEYLALVNSIYQGGDAGSNTGIDNSNSYYNVSEKSYTWQGDILEGQYAIVVSGYQKDDNNSFDPVCEQSFYFFEIKAPNRVEFTATKRQDEQCYNTNDGSVEITAAGGSGTYEYILNGSNWNGATTFTAAQSPLLISNMAPGTYNIQVRDSNSCYDKENADDSNKIITVTIDEINQITHTDVPDLIKPCAPGKDDGAIAVTDIRGGTPIVNNGQNYYNYELFRNSVSYQTGQALANNHHFIGLEAGNYKVVYEDARGCEQEVALPSLEDYSAITFQVRTVKNPSCSNATDGELEIISLTGGKPLYTYSWKKDSNPIAVSNGPTVSGGAGTYEVTISDSGCGTKTISGITFDNVPQILQITNIEATPIPCYGGSSTVTITATGGSSAEYQYAIYPVANEDAWQDSNVFSLVANTLSGYRFVARHKTNTTCISDPSDTKRIDQPEEITIDDISVVDNNIFGEDQGSITIEVSGGTAPYAISWKKSEDGSDPGDGLTISGLTTGNYIPTITDATGICTIVGDAIFVDQPDELLVTINDTAIPILCKGASGTLIANAIGGSENYTYSWFIDGNLIPGATSNTLVDVTTGNYSVRVEDGYTSASDAIFFSEPEALQFVASGTDASCYGGADGTIVISPQGGTRPYEFSMDNKQSYVSENDLTNFTIEGLTEGTYEVWIKDANGCEVETPQSVVIGQPTQIMIIEEGVTDVTVLGTNDGSIDISITGGTGDYTILWTRDEEATFLETTEDLTDIYFGNYTVTVTDANDCRVQRSFTVREPLPMNVEITLENPILCHGDALGELLATVTGGYPLESSPEDFQYEWFRIENGTEIPLNTDVSVYILSDLPAGFYKVVATDAKGTYAERNIEITQPDDLVVSLDGTPIHVLCHGEATGAINITVTGGPKDENTGTYLPYVYRWTKEEDPDFSAVTEDIANLTEGTYNVVIIDDNLCTVSIEKISITQPDAPLEISNVLAENLTGYQTRNGSISIDVSGGTIPYRYVWTNDDDPTYTSSSQDIRGLKRGTYRLMITDGNECTVSLEQLITEPDPLIIAIHPLTEEESVQCNGGMTLVPLTTSTTGGVEPYSYQWYNQENPSEVLFTNSVTDLIPEGTYTVVVTDTNGNTDSDTYTVEEPDPLVIAEQVTHLLCNNDTDGSIDVTITGGVTPYIYRWSNGRSTEDISDLRAGDYTLTVEDANECSISKTITVDQPGALFANIIRTYPSATGTDDGNITITMIGGTAPFTFQWREINGALLAETGNILGDIGSGKYAVTIIDANNCTLVIDDVDLFEPPALEVTIEQTNVISCNGNATTGSLIAVVQGGVPFNASKQYTYSWFDADSLLPVGTDAATLSNIGAGNYYVIVTDAVATSITSATFDLQEPEILEVALQADFMNCGDQEDWEITAQVRGGTAPYQYRWSTNDRTASLENQVAGTYSLQIIDQRGCTATKQITVTPPPTLEASHTVTIPTCYEGCDGRISLSVQGGSPPYMYDWSNDTTNQDLLDVCAGSYTVIITDAKGCEIQKTIAMANPEQLVVDLGEDITLCKDQSIVLDANINDTNASYSWTSDNGFIATIATPQVDQTGTYTVLVTDSDGCTATDSIFVEATTNEIYTNFIANSQVFVDETFVLVDISEPNPDTLEWEFPLEADVTYQDNDYAELSFDTPGEYEVTIYTSFGLCTEVHAKKILVVERTFEEQENPEGAEEKKIAFTIYPNPTPDGKFTIEADMPKVQSLSVKIYGIANNALLDAKKGEGKDFYRFEYDLRQLPGGVYFILFETSSGSQVHKLIIE